MTKKGAIDIFYMYDLSSWYQSQLDDQRFDYTTITYKELDKKCFNMFYKEVKDMALKDWQDGFNEEVYN